MILRSTNILNTSKLHVQKYLANHIDYVSVINWSNSEIMMKQLKWL